MRFITLTFVMALAVAASAQVLVSADFEEEAGYAPGNLQGQSSPPWNDSSGLQAFRVIGTSTPSGYGAVEINTGPIGPSWAWQPINPSQIQPTKPIIVASLWAKTARDPDGRPSSYAGLDAYQTLPNARMAAIRFRHTSGPSAGTVEVIANGQQYFANVPTPQPDTWYRTILMLNLTTGRACGSWDGHQVLVNNPAWFGPLYLPASRLVDVDLYASAVGYNRLFFDDLHVEAVETGTLQGTVTLSEYSETLLGVPITIQIRDQGGNIVDVQATTLDEQGHFRVRTPARGNYYVVAKSWHWLARLAAPSPLTVSDAGIHDLEFVLLNGDCNDDNSIDIADYAIISHASVSTPGMPNWDPRADLNADRFCDLSDYSILSFRYGMDGD